MEPTELDEPTPAEIARVMRHMSRQRTPDQRVGGRPVGYRMTAESKQKIRDTKARRRAGGGDAT